MEDLLQEALTAVILLSVVPMTAIAAMIGSPYVSQKVSFIAPLAWSSIHLLN